VRWRVPLATHRHELLLKNRLHAFVALLATLPQAKISVRFSYDANRTLSYRYHRRRTPRSLPPPRILFMLISFVGPGKQQALHRGSRSPGLIFEDTPLRPLERVAKVPMSDLSQ
jgi:hypothetical protein